MPRSQSPSSSPMNHTEPANRGLVSKPNKADVRLSDLESDGVVLRMMQAIHAKTKPAQVYSNASQAAASIRMGYAYMKSASAVDLNVLPLLLYYALLNWLKGLLYILDVSYPENTSVLQHGLSVRRTKRSSYRWAYDFVQVHREGVFPSFHSLCKISTDDIHSCGYVNDLKNRYVIGDLAGFLPYLRHPLLWTYPQFIHTFPIHRLEEVSEGALKAESRLREESSGESPTAEGFDSDVAASAAWGSTASWSAASGSRLGQVQLGLVPREIASHQEQTPDQWKHAYRGRSGLGDTADAADAAGAASLNPRNGRDDTLSKSTDPEGYLQIPFPSPRHPWVVQSQPEVFISDTDPPQMWMTHSILLFSLSALCRYNPTEWMDIVLWNNEKDAHLVRTYLDYLTQSKELENAVLTAFHGLISAVPGSLGTDS